MRSLSTRRSRRDVLGRLALLALAIPALGSGCGYSVRAPFDPKVKTVYVPVFRSLTFRRELQLRLTELTIKEIEKRTPYKVVGTPDEADTILECTVNFADKNIVVESPFNLPRQLSATIKSRISCAPLASWCCTKSVPAGVPEAENAFCRSRS